MPIHLPKAAARRLSLRLRRWVVLGARELARFVKTNVPIIVGGAFVAAATVISTVWPRHWSTALRDVLIGILAFLGVVVIEAHRREERSRAAKAAQSERRTRVAAHALATRPGVEPPERPIEIMGWPAQPELNEQIPERVSFRGRAAEVAALIKQHDAVWEAANARAGAGGAASGRPVVLLLHGMPGVGKSALAQHLASQLAEKYPDGQLYVNLGNAGDALSSAEILKSFLDALRWPGTIPELTSDRVSIFRTLTTGMRILFILDAARDHQQVLDVLPNESMCGVIVSSRRDLGPSLGFNSRLVDIPSAADALEILEAAAQSGGRSLEHSIKIVELCGRLPLALQSAGERVSQEGSELSQVAVLLREDETRLARLTRWGRNVEEGFASEYRQLDFDEQRALRRLGVVPSDSFVPWVLCPLLEISLDEAQDLVERLHTAQFVDYVAKDLVTGLVRYRLHPLVKLFARAQGRREDSVKAIAEASKRLDLAYEGVIYQVLDVLEPDSISKYSISEAPYGIAGQDLVDAIARHPDGWIRDEYPNLARSLRRAFNSSEWGICWRIAARLPALIPRGTTIEEVLSIFDIAMSAAQADNSSIGAIDVLIAKGGVLVALERYQEAFRALGDAAERAARVAGGGSNEDYLFRQGLVWLKRGEAYVQMRCPTLAEEELQRANEIFQGLECSREMTVIELMVALNFDTNVERPYDDLASLVGEENKFWVSVERSEERRRRRDWANAQAHLDEAEKLCVGDRRREANLLYRRARLFLEHYYSLAATGRLEITPDGRQLAQRAVGRATEAILLFESMANSVGELRARCLLVRTLVAASDFAAAKKHMHQVSSDLGELETSPAFIPLKARAGWARGDLMWHEGDEDCVEHLMEAQRLFGEIDDGRAQHAVEILLSRGRPRPPRQRDGAELNVDDAEADL